MAIETKVVILHSNLTYDQKIRAYEIIGTKLTYKNYHRDHAVCVHCAEVLIDEQLGHLWTPY